MLNGRNGANGTLWPSLRGYGRCSHCFPVVGLLALASRKDGAPLGVEASTSHKGDDLFPICTKRVATYLLDKGHEVSDAVACMVNSLNYLALYASGGVLPRAVAERSLTQAQEGAVLHLCDLVEHLRDSKVRSPGFQEASRDLGAARFDYAGEPVVPLEELVAEKVIQAWPKIGEAAVQDAIELVPEHLRRQLLDPHSCLKQLHEWPERPVTSKVRASPGEWEKIVAAAHARGLMVPVEVDDVFKDSSGHPVLNGAGGVRKLKKVGGETKELQRFISNLIRSNMYQERIDGDDKLLPYLGQLTLVEQGDSEIILVDSEDFVLQPVSLAPCMASFYGLWHVGGCEGFWRTSRSSGVPGDGRPSHGLAVVGGCHPVHSSHPGFL